MKSLFLLICLLAKSAFADQARFHQLAEYMFSSGSSRSTAELMHLADMSWALSLNDLSKEFLNSVVEAPGATKLQLSRAHLYLGIISFQDNDYIGAKAHAEMSRSMSWTKDATLLMAQALAALDLPEQALVELKGLDSDEARVSAAKLAMKTGKYDEVKSLLIEVSSDSELADQALDILVRACFQRGDFARLLTWFELIDKSQPETISYAIIANLREGNRKNALALYNEHKEEFGPIWKAIVEASLVNPRPKKNG